MLFFSFMKPWEVVAASNHFQSGFCNGDNLFVENDFLSFAPESLLLKSSNPFFEG